MVYFFISPGCIYIYIFTFKELKTRNPDDIICPPVLLPGEKLILQQDKVTCVKTFIYPATGALHLTNYRIIFSGKYLKVSQMSPCSFIFTIPFLLAKTVYDND